MKPAPVLAAFALLALLVLPGCAPQGGGSEGCPGGTTWGAEPVNLWIKSLDGVPVTGAGGDLRVARRSGEARTAALALELGLQSGWCGSSYAGALTLGLAGLPAGATATFAPATLPAATGYAPRTSVATLALPATVADGSYALQFTAPEGRLTTAGPWRLVVVTTP